MAPIIFFKSDSACVPFLFQHIYGAKISVTSILAGSFKRAAARRERFGVAAAAAATPVDSLARAPTRHHANRRGLLYLRQEAHGHRTDRPCVPLRPTLACAHPAQVAVKPLMSIPSKAGAKRSHASVAQSLVGSGPARLLLRSSAHAWRLRAARHSLEAAGLWAP